MSALIDFYKKARTEPGIMEDIVVTKRGLGNKPSQDAVYSAITRIAKKHGITLSRSDFKQTPDNVLDKELKAAFGGNCSSFCADSGANGWANTCFAYLGYPD